MRPCTERKGRAFSTDPNVICTTATRGHAFTSLRSAGRKKFTSISCGVDVHMGTHLSFLLAGVLCLAFLQARSVRHNNYCRALVCWLVLVEPSRQHRESAPSLAEGISMLEHGSALWALGTHRYESIVWSKLQKKRIDTRVPIGALLTINTSEHQRSKTIITFYATRRTAHKVRSSSSSTATTITTTTTKSSNCVCTIDSRMYVYQRQLCVQGQAEIETITITIWREWDGTP